MIVIEKGVPIPEKNRRTQYPFDDMEVGDSFLVGSNPKKIYGSAYYHSKRTGKKFIVRKTGTAYRCWRVE